jgi:hypothetical protein
MRGLVRSFALVLVLSPASCRSKPSPEQPPAGSASAAHASATSAPSSEDPPSPREGPRNTARLARCGWGSLKVDPGVEAPPWAIALVDIEVSHPTKGLRITALELAGGGIAAEAGERRTLRVQDGAVRFSFSAAETHELESTLPVGSSRLRAATALDRPAKAIAAHKPTHCTVVLSDSSGEELVATGPVDPAWENE